MTTDGLVGRERELDELDHHLAAARAGRGRIVLVAGEAGAGKTALASAFADRAGVRVAWGSCHEESVPYEPWIPVLRTLGSPISGMVDAADNRFRLFDDVVRVITGAAPVLVVLDDLHWADASSLRLLQALAAGIADAAVLVVGLYRPDADTQPPPTGPHPANAGTRQRTPGSHAAGTDPQQHTLDPRAPDAGAEQAALLRAIARDRVTTEIPLRGLAPAAVAALAAGTVGHQLPEDLVRQLGQRSGGNPLFVRELARLAETGGGPLPAGIRDVIGRRLGRLPAGLHETLRLASVLGPAFSPEMLGRISRDDTVGPARDDSVGNARDDTVGNARDDTAGTDLDRAVDAGLLIVDGRTLRFDHVLTQEVLYAQLPTAQRRRLHARAAAAALDLDARAYHLRQAGPLIDGAEVLAATLAAARQARRRLAFEHAAAQYREAHALAPADPAILLELAACEFRSGAVERAWISCRAAADLGRARGDARIMADAATALRGVTQSPVTPQIHALCRETLALLSAGDETRDETRNEVRDEVRRARVLAQLAVTADPFVPGTEPDLGERALAAAEASGDRPALAMALHARYTELLNPAHLRDRLALGARAVGLDEESACWGHTWRLDAYTELGDGAGISAELAALSALVEHRREPLWLWRLALIRAARAMFEGRFEHARRYAAEALAAGRRGGSDAAEFFQLVFDSNLAQQTGEGLPEVEAAVRRAIEHMPLFARGWLAQILITMGRLDEAAALWSGLAPHLELLPGRALEWMIASAGNAAVCVALGDDESGKIVYGQLLPYADRFVSGAAHTPNEGPVSLYLGMLAALGADPGRTEEHLSDALIAARAAGSPPFEARARTELARFLQSRRSPGDARAANGHLELAQRIADRTGMAPLAAQIRELRRVPALSVREEEVAALVADGLSNRQIAARLRLSERTAENHVTHILTKLGFDSRARIAAWYASAERPR